MCRNVLTAARFRPEEGELLARGRRNQVSPFQLDRSDSSFCRRGQPSLPLADFDPPFSDALLCLAGMRCDGPGAGAKAAPSPDSPFSFTLELH